MGNDFSATCGYGICLEDIPNITTKGLLKLLEIDPDEIENVQYCYEESIENLDPIEILNECYKECGDAILARIMSNYIQAIYGLYFEPCEDFDGCEYLIYPSEYPWNEDYDKYSAVSKNEIDRALRETVSAVSDSDFNIKVKTQECVVQWG